MHPRIPYFQTTRIRVNAIVELACVKYGELAVDLGVGDGRISIALAKAGAKVTGYEIEQNLLHLAEENIKKENLEKLISVYYSNFWEENLSAFKIVTCYPMPDILEPLEKKLKNELKRGARVLINYYPFPSWKYVEKKENIYLYTV